MVHRVHSSSKDGFGEKTSSCQGKNWAAFGGKVVKKYILYCCVSNEFKKQILNVMQLASDLEHASQSRNPT